MLAPTNSVLNNLKFAHLSENTATEQKTQMILSGQLGFHHERGPNQHSNGGLGLRDGMALGSDMYADLQEQNQNLFEHQASEAAHDDSNLRHLSGDY